MLGRILLLVAAVPIVELIVMVNVHRYWKSLWGSSDAWLLTLGSLFLAALIGSYFARRQAIKLLREAQDQLRQGSLPSRKLLAGLLLVIGGTLLIIPGYISDVFGILLLIPWTRSFIVLRVLRWLERKIKLGHLSMHTAHQRRHPYNPGNAGQTGDVIDVELSENISSPAPASPLFPERES